MERSKLVKRATERKRERGRERNSRLPALERAKNCNAAAQKDTFVQLQIQCICVSLAIVQVVVGQVRKLVRGYHKN